MRREHAIRRDSLPLCFLRSAAGCLVNRVAEVTAPSIQQRDVWQDMDKRLSVVRRVRVETLTLDYAHCIGVESGRRTRILRADILARFRLVERDGKPVTP